MSNSGCLEQILCRYITWEELAWPLLFWPIITALGLFVLLLPLQPVFAGKVSRWQANYIGTADTPPVHKVLINILYIMQMLCSGAHTCIWVHRTYTHEVTKESKWVEVGLCGFFALHYLVNCLKSQCDRSFVLSKDTAVDVLTIFPVFYFASYDATDIPWITLSYLRCYKCVLAYERVEKTGVLKDVSDVTRGAIIVTLKGISLVVILGCTVMMLEILGDPEFMDGTTYTQTNFGDVSFVQMFYWIFTTISTVGYGDFSPTTVLSQLFSPVCIIVGVTFFTQETGEMLELISLEDSGMGRFTPKPSGSEHLVVVGGGVANCSAILENFLHALYHEQPHHHFPNCVLMAPGEASSQLREVLAKLPKHARMRVKYLAGSCMCAEDLDRVRLKDAKLGIVICDTQSSDPDQEDQGNILRALAMKRFERKLDLRLMLLRPESKARAVQVGIRASRCFSVNELKSNLLAVSCRCAGWTTMVANFMTTSQLSERNDLTTEPWFNLYEKSKRTKLNGFCIKGDFIGKSFQEFAKDCFKMDVALIAVQVDGKIKLNPIGYILKENDVLFALADDRSAVLNLSNLQTEWTAVFSTAQAQIAPTPAAAQGKRFVGAESDPTDKFPGLGPSDSGDSGREGAPIGPTFGGPMVIAAGLQHQAGRSQLPGQGVQDKIKKRARLNAESARMPRGVGKLQDDELLGLEDMARIIGETGGHILLVVLSTATVWQQVQAFTRGIRMQSLPRSTPLVILSNEQPERDSYHEICKHYDCVGIVVGAPHKTADMERAGMREASTIILLAGRPSIDDWRMVDGNGIMTLQSVEGQTKANVVLELLNEESARLLTRMPMFSPIENAHAQISGRKGAGGVLGAAQKAVVKHVQDDLAKINDMVLSDEEAMMQEKQQEEAFSLLPRFAGGNIFCASCLGAMVAVANYVPGVIELTEALVSGEDTGQECFPWQISVPPGLIGKTYLELATSLLDGFPSTGAANVALRAVPLGVYRHKDRAVSNDTAIVITNPPSSFKLQSEDLVFVLGSAAFAQACFAHSHLRGIFNREEPSFPEESNLQPAAAPDENLGASSQGASQSQPALQKAVTTAQAEGIPAFVAGGPPGTVELQRPDAVRQDNSPRQCMPYCCMPEGSQNSDADARIVIQAS